MSNDENDYTNNSNYSQEMKILRYLIDHDSITPKEAEELFDCMRLASRINQLRLRGNKIITTMEKGVNKHGKACRYARYSLAE